MAKVHFKAGFFWPFEKTQGKKKLNWKAEIFLLGTLSYALEGFSCFHTLLYPFQHCHIHFSMLSYAFHTLFICFHMLFIHFHTLSYAFYMLSYTFKRKEAKRPLPSLNVPRTQGIVRLSRCAAGKNPLSANSFQPLVIFTWCVVSTARGSNGRAGWKLKFNFHLYARIA